MIKGWFYLIKMIQGWFQIMNQLFQIIPSFNSSTDGSSPRVVCLHTCTPAPSMGWVGGYRCTRHHDMPGACAYWCAYLYRYVCVCEFKSLYAIHICICYTYIYIYIVCLRSPWISVGFQRFREQKKMPSPGGAFRITCGKRKKLQLMIHCIPWFRKIQELSFQVTAVHNNKNSCIYIM